MNALDFGARKREGKPLTLTTCCDFWSARILDDSDIDGLLVGDSLAMVMYGHESTLAATTELMALHTRAVARGAPTKFLITDMPFPSFRRGISGAMATVDVLMKAGTNAVKLEGIRGHEDVVEHIVGSGVPVMGHLGLTPQSVHALGGFKVQGTTDDAVEQMVDDAKRLEQAGCFGIVLECVPTVAARASRPRSRCLRSASVQAETSTGRSSSSTTSPGCSAMFRLASSGDSPTATRWSARPSQLSKPKSKRARIRQTKKPTNDGGPKDRKRLARRRTDPRIARLRADDGSSTRRPSVADREERP